MSSRFVHYLLCLQRKLRELKQVYMFRVKFTFRTQGIVSELKRSQVNKVYHHFVFNGSQKPLT